MYNYIINNKFVSQTHPIEGLSEIGDIPQEILRFAKIVNSQVVLDVEKKLASEAEELAKHKQERKAIISSAAKNSIENGFNFNGSIYPTKLEDQFNIKSLYDIGGAHKIRCTRDGLKTFYDHTEQEIQNLLLNFITFVKTVLQEADLKYQLIDAAVDHETINNIN